MSSTTKTRTAAQPGLGRTPIIGAIAGLIASMVMAMFAMIAAATYPG